jgi:hypothetical protein
LKATKSGPVLTTVAQSKDSATLTQLREEVKRHAQRVRHVCLELDATIAMMTGAQASEMQMEVTKLLDKLRKSTDTIAELISDKVVSAPLQCRRRTPDGDAFRTGGVRGAGDSQATRGR